MARKVKRDRDGLHRRPNLPNGIYYFYYRGNDGRWREKSTGTTSYTEARDIRSREFDKIRNSQMPSQFRDWILEKVAEIWLQRQKALVSAPTTVIGYRWILKRSLRSLAARS
jgi:hypothetical protein